MRIRTLAGIAIVVLATATGAGSAEARPTDVNVVSSTGGYPAAPAYIYIAGANTSSSYLDISKTLPTGYDFVATSMSGEINGGALTGGNAGTAGSPANPYIVPTVLSGTLSVFNQPILLRLSGVARVYLSFVASTGYKALYMAFYGYWIDETTGALRAPPSGFKADAGPARPEAAR